MKKYLPIRIVLYVLVVFALVEILFGFSDWVEASKFLGFEMSNSDQSMLNFELKLGSSKIRHGIGFCFVFLVQIFIINLIEKTAVSRKAS